MVTSLFLQRILNLSDDELSMFTKVIKKKKWESFEQLLALFPENNTELTTIRNKIKSYISSPTKAP
jgi:mRNA-degrading endonuclease HigB of HigAB toxin-antitoxin module